MSLDNARANFYAKAHQQLDPGPAFGNVAVAANQPANFRHNSLSPRQTIRIYPSKPQPRCQSSPSAALCSLCANSAKTYFFLNGVQTIAILTKRRDFNGRQPTASNHKRLGNLAGSIESVGARLQKMRSVFRLFYGSRAEEPIDADETTSQEEL